MGSAIAFAIVQPPLYSLLVFVSMGFGMALPFLLISYMPALGNWLPRPGPWMVVFKQAMAFPLYLTSIWLLWVLGRQTSATGMAVVLIGMVLILFAIWLQHIKPPPRGTWRKVSAAVAAISDIAALVVLFTPVLRTAPMTNGVVDNIADGEFWQPFSAKRLADLRAAGRLVFINMSADWCIIGGETGFGDVGPNTKHYSSIAACSCPNSRLMTVSSGPAGRQYDRSAA